MAFSADNRGCSWMQLILPYIDQRNIHKQIFFGWPLSDPQNTQIAKTRIPVYECPSDTHDGRMTFRANVPGVWAVTNYKASCGANWAWGQFSPVVTQKGRNALKPDGLDENTGLIGRCGWTRVTTTRLADVRDGHSTTIALGEAVPEWSRHTWWWWFNATTATCAIPLNFRNEPDLQEAGQGDWHHNYSFKSRHTGGGHFAFVDGSVRFVSDSIDRDVYRGLGTIQGSEVIATGF